MCMTRDFRMVVSEKLMQVMEGKEMCMTRHISIVMSEKLMQVYGR